MIKHEKKEVRLFEYLESHYIPYEVLINITHYKTAYRYAMKYKNYLIAFDPIKGWKVSHDIIYNKKKTLEKYSNIIYNQEIFEQVVKKVFDEDYVK